MTLRLVAVLVALGCSACGKLVTDGEVMQSKSCTQLSESESWPVKVLFVVEKSNGMCVLDAPGSASTHPTFCDEMGTSSGFTVSGRVRALSEFFQANAGRPNVSASIATFAHQSEATAFQAVEDGPPLELPTLQAELGTMSDLQGGLELAATRLSEDMEATPLELRARAKYVVVVLSKGIPFPRCSANDSLPVYASPSEPWGTWADSPAAEPFCSTGVGLRGETLPGFVPGGDRNQNAQLIAAVESIVALKARFGVGDVRVHSALLFDDARYSNCPVCQQSFFGASSRELGIYTLQQLALHGQGTFVDPGSPQHLSLAAMDSAQFTTFCP